MNTMQQANAIRDHLIALRRDLHAHPEVSLREFRTAQRIEEELDALGIEHRRVDGTGVLGILRGGGAGETLILRADTDALPIREDTGAPYASQNDGVMHACGHDAHTACLLGAARILAENRHLWRGEIRLAFQHAEEIGHGAKPFLAEGIADGAARAFGIHVAPDLPIGTVGVKPHMNNAAVDHLRIVIRGRSAHVSTPQQGVDALYIASQTVVALQALVTRRTSPTEPVIVGIGTLQAGTAYNALAETAQMEGTTRTVSLETREMLRRDITRLAENTAALYGGSAEVTWQDFASPLLNDPGVCTEVTAMAESLLGPGCVTALRPVALSGDDFADFTLAVPGAYVYLGTGNPAKPGTQSAAHSCNFDIDEDALPIGAALYAGYAMDRLGK